MFDWSTLRAACEFHVAREIARPLCGNELSAWIQLTEKSLPQAGEKINAMSNMELLDLIATVVAERQ